MKLICKSHSPEQFEKWKETPRSWRAFKRNGDIKKIVKRALVEEQGFICCYCGKRIECDDTTSIEHFLPKGLDKYKYLELEYTNLLASCNGGKKQREEQRKKGEEVSHPLSCDPHKGEKIVSISPLDEICEEKIKYNANGSIKGIDKAGNELIDKLNLNNDVLNNLRMDAIEPFVNPLPEVDQIPEIIAYMESMHSGQYHPFCVAISQVLNNMI